MSSVLVVNAGSSSLKLRMLGPDDAVDEGRNAAAEPDCDISAPGAAVRTLVITAREDVEIARQARAVLAGAS
jgi:acetate kinase